MELDLWTLRSLVQVASGWLSLVRCTRYNGSTRNPNDRSGTQAPEFATRRRPRAIFRGPKRDT
jgi:hypothetical protein